LLTKMKVNLRASLTRKRSSDQELAKRL
jgi:hypothetical protein